MRLQWKYSLIINLSVLAILVTFYVIDDIKARNDLNDLHTKGVSRGVIFKEIAEKTIRRRVEEKMAPRQALYRDEVEATLRDLKQENPEMREVLDINVTFGLNPKIQASLLRKSKNDYINLTGEDLDEIKRNGAKVYDTPPLNGQYATAVIIPYQVDVIGTEFQEKQIMGFIQVIFEVPDIAQYQNELRLIHLISVLVVSVLLVFIIDVTTTRLIMRPLEQMMEIIKYAEAGNLESLPQSYTSGEIGRVTLSLVRMLRQLKESHSKRIAALGQLAAGVTHEIRNPLGAIRGAVQLLKKELGPKARWEEHLNVLVKEVDRVNRILELLLDLGRPVQLRPAPLNVHQLLERVALLTEGLAAERGVTILRRYDPSLPPILGDEDRLIQVFHNLVRNAIEAMPGGGRLTLTTRLSLNPLFAKVDLGSGIRSTVEVQVADEGEGIPAASRAKIFDPFFTTKDKGLGLGLSLCHRILEEHRGAIRVESAPGKGTTVTCFLPIAR